MMSKVKADDQTIENHVRYRYVTVEETRTNEDNVKYVTYGLSVRTAEGEMAFVGDVSTDHEAVNRLAELCTEQELAPEHLGDVIEDFLAERYENQEEQAPPEQTNDDRR